MQIGTPLVNRERFNVHSTPDTALGIQKHNEEPTPHGFLEL